jgi:anti-sigma factor RsiW
MAERRSILSWWRCRRLRGALVDYVEGALRVEVRHAVERHVTACPRCVAALAALRNVPPAVVAAAPVPDEAFWTRQRRAIMDAIDTLPPVQPAPPERVRFDWRLALAPATALVIAVAGYFSVQQMISETGPSARAPIGDDMLVAMAVAEEATWWVQPAELIPGEAWVDDAALGALAAAAWEERSAREGETLPGLEVNELDFLSDLVGREAG